MTEKTVKFGYMNAFPFSYCKANTKAKADEDRAEDRSIYTMISECVSSSFLMHLTPDVNVRACQAFAIFTLVTSLEN